LNYLTSKVNSFFLAEYHFKYILQGIKEKLLTENDEESPLVDKRFELSNLDLVKGLMEVVESLVFLIP